ncbi:hypothetical protein D7B24_003571 [Verticillium nonalfalfae]|uniref:AT hook domain-containing protein n=1 Tax=Verticillium nonalfalfae TaxID=1051616 RepID=A0A3M9YEX8_9PEZI|nr:uncharacterized protein D7B24_003571 [Verticillium nonalfalfae]RNJ59019.1 hypothetical protein D7B24_003571 [Verticillium nonalfalfae]
MATHNIIADSDEEDDFTPGQSPTKPQTPVIAPASRSPTTGNGTDSTDPRFFQAIYSEQQQAVERAAPVPADHSFDAADNTSSSISLNAHLQKKTGIENTSSLTSVSDPAPRRPRAAHLVSPGGVTQPSPPAGNVASTMKDVWDIPSSPEATALPMPKRSLISHATGHGTTFTKYANAGRGFSPTPEAAPSSGLSDPPIEAMPERNDVATPPHPADQQWPQHAGLGSPTQQNSPTRISEARQCPVSGQKPTAPLASDSLLSDQPASMPGVAAICIEPTTLSTSQRALYQSLHPSPDEEAMQDFDGAAHFKQAMSGMGSSGATTIAYATPSQWRKSSHPVVVEPKEASSPATSRKKRARVLVDAEPASSPDLLAVEERPGKRGKTAKRKTDKATARRSATRQVKDSDDDDEDDGAGEDDDDDDFTAEAYQPRPSWRRAIGARLRGVEGNAEEEEQMAAIAAATHVAETQKTPMVLLAAESDSPPPRKKRGRPKKAEMPTTPQVNEPLSDGQPQIVEDAKRPSDTTLQAVDAFETDQHAQAPPAEAAKPGKRKRGRPRKSDQAATPKAAPIEVPVETPVVCVDDITSGTTMDGAATDGPAGGLPDEDVPAVTPHARGDKRALGDASGNPIKSADDVVKLDKVETQEEHERNERGATPAKPKAAKSTATSTKREPQLPVTPQAGKPLYRVGLSKRSRIAPLLKSLRKT